jgi:cell division protein FtsL
VKDIRNGSAVTLRSLSRLPSRTRRNQRFLVLSLTFGFAGLMGFVLFSHVWSRLRVLDLGYALAARRTLNQKLQQENRELRIELATLTSPERLESLARIRLGMRPASPDKVIILP